MPPRLTPYIDRGALFFHFNLHPAGQGEGDPVPGVDHHAVNQCGPLALVKPGDELRQIFQAVDEPLNLPAYVDCSSEQAVRVKQEINDLQLAILLLKNSSVTGDRHDLPGNKFSA